MGVVAVLRATRGLVIVRQSLSSIEAFGDLRGSSWADVSRRHASAEANRACRAAIEEASDLRSVARCRVWSPEPGAFSARWIDDGEVLTTWRPMTLDEQVEAFMARWSAMLPPPAAR